MLAVGEDTGMVTTAEIRRQCHNAAGQEYSENFFHDFSFPDFFIE
jgi:hypothetical protein